MNSVAAPLAQVSPHSIEAEQCLLGSILIDSQQLDTIRTIVLPEDFYKPEHEKIYRAMLGLGSAVDLMSLNEMLSTRGWLDEVGGRSMAVSMMNMVPSASYAERYARTVASCARRRALITVAGRIASIAYEEPDADNAEARALGALRSTILNRTSLARSTAR